MSNDRDEKIPEKLYDKASADLDQRIDRLIIQQALAEAWRNEAPDEQAPYGAKGKPRISDSERETLLARVQELAAQTPLIGEDRKEEAYIAMANLIDRVNFKSNYLDTGLRTIRHIGLHDDSKQLSYLTEKTKTTAQQKTAIAETMQHVREQLQDALIEDVRITDAEAAQITQAGLAELQAKNLPQAVLDQAAKLIPHIATMTNREKTDQALESMTNDAEYERAKLTGAKPRKAYIRE